MLTIASDPQSADGSNVCRSQSPKISIQNNAILMFIFTYIIGRFPIQSLGGGGGRCIKRIPDVVSMPK